VHLLLLVVPCLALSESGQECPFAFLWLDARRFDSWKVPSTSQSIRIDPGHFQHFKTLLGSNYTSLECE
jgi:hypothetical protein